MGICHVTLSLHLRHSRQWAHKERAEPMAGKPGFVLNQETGQMEWSPNVVISGPPDVYINLSDRIPIEESYQQQYDKREA